MGAKEDLIDGKSRRQRTGKVLLLLLGGVRGLRGRGEDEETTVPPDHDDMKKETEKIQPRADGEGNIDT